MEGGGDRECSKENKPRGGEDDDGFFGNLGTTQVSTITTTNLNGTCVLALDDHNSEVSEIGVSTNQIQRCKKKRGCLSKSPRSSVWGTLANLTQIFGNTKEGTKSSAASNNNNNIRFKVKIGKDECQSSVMTANGCEEEKLLDPLTMNKSTPLKLYNNGISSSSENLISSATATVFAETFQVESGTKVEIPSSVVGSNIGDQYLNAWVRCDNCHKWRCIPSKDADTIEEIKCTWTCKDNMDKAFADCSIPQEKSNKDINAELGLSEEEEEEEEEDVKPPTVVPACVTIRTNQYLHRSRKTQTVDEMMICQCKPPLDGRLGCGDDCLNRVLNIECMQGTCPCRDLCSNQQFQKRKYAKLEKFSCGKKGYGLKLLEDVSKGYFVIEYVGEVLDMQSYVLRQKEYALKGHKHFYFMTLDCNEVIDACVKGNKGRFINHSCEPNCQTEKWMVNGEICIGLFALRDIKKGEEVTFDYNYVRVFGAVAKKCYCGSNQCRGYIGGDPLNKEDGSLESDSDEVGNSSCNDVIIAPISECDVSQQREDVTQKLIPSAIERLSSSSQRFNRILPVEMLSKSGIADDRLLSSKAHPNMKKGKVKTNPSNASKVLMKSRKAIEGSFGSCFYEVEEKLDDLLDDNGGISKHKDAPKFYLKLLYHTAKSGDNIVNGETIQRNRDLSMILDALLKTKSRLVLNDIINNNGLRMLHNIMKQYKADFKKIPILRKLLKVLEYLAVREIINCRHISKDPPCPQMESFTESILSLTKHGDKHVHQIARNFCDKWIRKQGRKLTHMGRDENKTELSRSSNCNRFSVSQNDWSDHDRRPSEAFDCVKQPVIASTLVSAGIQEGSSASHTSVLPISGTRNRKRKSRWDQVTWDYPVVTRPVLNDQLDKGDDFPPGFSLSLGVCHVGQPQEKFLSGSPVSYGIPLSIIKQFGQVPETGGSWVVAPGMPFHPFPPLPPLPPGEKDSSPGHRRHNKRA
uniref:Histone-lysine N-methyltransferase ASHH2 n=1 Tax=Cannabis sativa TaxID=3483 RepID=A0A803QKC0_CANSA